MLNWLNILQKQEALKPKVEEVVKVEEIIHEANDWGERLNIFLY